MNNDFDKKYIGNDFSIKMRWKIFSNKKYLKFGSFNSNVLSVYRKKISQLLIEIDIYLYTKPCLCTTMGRTSCLRKTGKKVSCLLVAVFTYLQLVDYVQCLSQYLLYRFFKAKLFPLSWMIGNSLLSFLHIFYFLFLYSEPNQAWLSKYQTSLLFIYLSIYLFIFNFLF